MQIYAWARAQHHKKGELPKWWIGRSQLGKELFVIYYFAVIKEHLAWCSTLFEVLPSTISLSVPRPRFHRINVSKSPSWAYLTIWEAASPCPVTVSTLTSLLEAICLHFSKYFAILSWSWQVYHWGSFATPCRLSEAPPSPVSELYWRLSSLPGEFHGPVLEESL